MTGIDPATWAAFCAVPSEEHFTPFYEQSKGLVWTLCRRILRDEDETQDAFQGVYARLLVHARQAGAAAVSASS
jgi:DNA-directed RNA polymerase specialized sigma24 family protein